MTLVYIAAAWTIGILLAAWLALPTVFWVWMFILPVGAFIIARRHPPLRYLQILLLFLLLGAARYQLALPSPADEALAQFNDKGSVAIIGIVYDDPTPGDRYQQVRVETSRIKRDHDWEDITGRVLVWVPRDLTVRYGDEVRVEGELNTPSDGADFSYRDFLARDVVLSQMLARRATVTMHDMGNPVFATIYQFRASALDAVSTLFPEPSAALLSGILLGRDEGIPTALSEAFKSTNTGHIIAISGFNIAVLSGMLNQYTKRRRWFGFFLVAAALIFYTLLVGASASVVRAAIMGILVVLAERLERQAWPLISLAVSAILMTLLNPYTLWDVGFQLSFLATLGLVLYSNKLQERTEQLLSKIVSNTRAKNIVRFLSESFIVTLAAWITTTPLLIAVFHRLSLIGLLTNLLVLPVQPAVMILSGLATLVQLAASSAVGLSSSVSLLLAAVASVFAAAGYVFTQYTILVVEWTACVPYASIETPRMDMLLAGMLYLALFLYGHVSLRALPGWLFRTPERVAGSLALVSVIVWNTFLAFPDPRTHIQFIATSGGEATLIQTASGSRILIDGSSEPSALLGHLGEQTTFWDRRIDLLVLTQLDENNVSSLNAVLERYKVGQVIEPRPPSSKGGTSYQEWRQVLADKGISSTVAEQGVRVQADEVGIEVLAPSEESRGTNVALRLTANNHRVVLAPSLSADDLDNVAVSDADWTADIAALPNKIDPTLLKRIDPGSVVLFVGRSIREQPASESLQQLGDLQVLRTDERGDVEVIIDGEKMEVRTEK